MKLAVLSDIHGNLPALEAVLEDILLWNPHEIIVNGDLVSRGPYSLECLGLLKRTLPGVHLLTGNHESYVLRCVDTPADPASPTREIDRFADWTVGKLAGAVEELRNWGDHLDFTGLDQGASAHITHGSRLGNRDGIFANTPDGELAEKLGDPRDLFIGSHTHKPLLRRFNATLVVNTGSVGQPLDSDPRAAYGRFCLRGGQWRAEIVRLEYDKPRAEQDFIDSGFVAEAGPMAQLIYREMRESRPHVGPWARQYLEAVKAGRIRVSEAVRAYLQGL